jgi:integrase
MRREEIGQLKAPNCASGVLRLTEGKTSAAVREVPVHPVIRPLVDSLMKSSRDGWLVPGLKPGGPDNKRTWYVGKKFGRDIRALGVTDPRLDFHALRGTFITAMEEAGVPVPTIQQIVGHERQGVTLGVYSSGVSFQVRTEAVQRVTFGEVDALVSERI